MRCGQAGVAARGSPARLAFPQSSVKVPRIWRGCGLFVRFDAAASSACQRNVKLPRPERNLRSRRARPPCLTRRAWAQRFGLLFILIIICAKNPETVQIVCLFPKPLRLHPHRPAYQSAERILGGSLHMLVQIAVGCLLTSSSSSLPRLILALPLSPRHGSSLSFLDSLCRTSWRALGLPLCRCLPCAQTRFVSSDMPTSPSVSASGVVRVVGRRVCVG